MANDALFKYGSEVTLTSAGASCANAGFVSCSNALASASHSNYPLADFALKTVGTGASLASSGSLTINLYRRPINFDGSSGDEEAVSSSLKAHYVGSFTLKNSAASDATLYNQLDSVPLVADQEFWLECNFGTTLTSGWTLKCTPKTFTPST